MAEKYQFPDETDENDLKKGGEVENSASEVEIEVVDDTPERDRGRKPLDAPVEDPTDDELGSYSDAVKQRIQKLTHARHDERRAKEALMREREELARATQQLLNENRQLKQYVNTGEQQFVNTVQQAVYLELDAAKRAYKEAYEAGDADKVLEAQEKLTEVQMRAQQARNFRPTPLQVDAPVVQMPQPAPQKPTLDEKTLRWQAKNQWFGSPGHEDLTAYSLGLHQKLVSSGLDPRSDEYFEQIDARMRKTFPDFFGSAASSAQPDGSTKRNASVVAPASRSTAKRKVTLSKSAEAIARRLGLTNEQYATEVLKLEKQNG